MSDVFHLGELVVGEKDLSVEARKRRKEYDTQSVGPDEVADLVSQGWEKDPSRKLKSKIPLRKRKAHDERLENRLWLLFQKMGYEEMSSGRRFKIAVKRRSAQSLEKQIDVFAKDSETVLVAECKSSKKLQRRTLQKDLEEWGNLKGPIAASIKKHYGAGFNPKIVWLFVTENIIWSEPDKQRAAGQNIKVITERELGYYNQLSEHLGTAARFQFLAEFLQDQKIPELKDHIIPAVRGKIAGNRFFSFVTTPENLLKISFVNHRSLNDPDGIPSYQRLISKTRMKQIGKFLNGGGFFPTSILVNFTRKIQFDVVKKDEKTNVTFGYMHMPDRYRSAWVVDGQHRLYGYAHSASKGKNDIIFVTGFEGLAKEDEANMFVTINHEQKSVPKNLLDDLEGELKWGSEKPAERIGAISARLINILNDDLGEPFYGRITRQGIPATNTTCLTVPGLKEGLRKSGLVGRSILKHKVYEPGPLSGKNDSETLDRARRCLNIFFGGIRESAPGEWAKGRPGHLCTNVAIQGYTYFLAALIDYMQANKGMDPKELSPEEILIELEEYLEPISTWLESADGGAFENVFKVQFGSGGPREYYYRICRITKEQIPDFLPEGMEDWESERSEERVLMADSRLKDIGIWVQKYIFSVLKTHYGEDTSEYFEKGIGDNSIVQQAFGKSLEVPPEDRLPLENYLDFIQYKKIVEKKVNWPLFKDVFNIEDEGEKGKAKNISWMDRINELRRIPAHPTEKRTYKLHDYDRIDFVWEELSNRLSQKGFFDSNE